MGVGALSLALIDENTSFAFIEIAFLVVGVGLGLNTAPVNGVAVAALPPERSGTASGVLNTSRMRELDFLKLVFGATFDPTQYRMLLFGLAMVLIMPEMPNLDRA